MSKYVRRGSMEDEFQNTILLKITGERVNFATDGINQLSVKYPALSQTLLEENNRKEQSIKELISGEKVILNF